MSSPVSTKPLRFDGLLIGQFSILPNVGLTSSSSKKKLSGIDYLEDVFNYVMMIALIH
jgi:hypothetical protein